MRFQTHLGNCQSAVDQAMLELENEKVIQRIWNRDTTVWRNDPAEIENRLGWLHSPEVMAGAVGDIMAFVAQTRSRGFTHAVLLGMGGSSLAPEVFRLIFGTTDGHPDLSVLDSTDPGAILATLDRIDLTQTLFIVSTKSGGTVETLSLLKYFYNLVLADAGAQRAGDRFVAITDPGSGLEALASNLGFSRIFLNDPHIGGRYSALSYFGLVPAALIGLDLNLLLKKAAATAAEARGSARGKATDNTAACLGAAMGALATMGKDKVTLVISAKLAPFGAWVEQLIAESTGKDDKGILPVAGEALGSPECYSGDRLFVRLRLENDTTDDAASAALIDSGHPLIDIQLGDLYDLGGDLFRWEMATVVAGRIIGINPFDQPNVESAKVLAREMVARYRENGQLPRLTPSLETDGMRVFTHLDSTDIDDALKQFLAQAEPGSDLSAGRSYVALQAYVTPNPETDAALSALRATIQRKLKLAATVGYGPRFLHSTGQLHKGDAGHGLFIQFIADIPQDLPIPDEPGSQGSVISFGVLKTAQAMGDRQALLDAGRKLITFDLGADVAGNLDKLNTILTENL